LNPVEKKKNLLELIHNDFCDSNNVLTRSGKRYFITFIDNFSIYSYIYLKNSKNELFDKFKISKGEVENQLKK
jgi:histone deacetylase 1/2